MTGIDLSCLPVTQMPFVKCKESEIDRLADLHQLGRSMRSESMRSMRCGFIFRSEFSKYLCSVTKEVEDWHACECHDIPFARAPDHGKQIPTHRTHRTHILKFTKRCSLARAARFLDDQDSGREKNRQVHSRSTAELD